MAVITMAVDIITAVADIMAIEMCRAVWTTPLLDRTGLA
jgi:hypothetical protein